MSRSSPGAPRVRMDVGVSGEAQRGPDKTGVALVTILLGHYLLALASGAAEQHVLQSESS